MTRNGYFGALATKLRRLPRPVAGVETEGPSADTFRTTHVLPDFVTEVRARTAPVVIDLGPAIGSNVAFLGQEFACKLFIEDLLARRANGSSGSGPALRLRQPDGSVDGILCWDVLDHLAPAARPLLVAELVRVLRPSGVLLLYHRVEVAPHPDRVVYEIVSPRRLCLHRDGDASVRVERPLKHRELELIFGELTAVKTVLLKNRMREVLFRKSKLASAVK